MKPRTKAPCGYSAYRISVNYPVGPDDKNVEGEALKPPDSCRPGMKFIRPVFLTGRFMTAACLFAYKARRCNYWSNTNMTWKNTYVLAM
jgi:hypothetical protein